MRISSVEAGCALTVKDGKVDSCLITEGLEECGVASSARLPPAREFATGFQGLPLTDGVGDWIIAGNAAWRDIYSLEKTNALSRRRKQPGLPRVVTAVRAE